MNLVGIQRMALLTAFFVAYTASGRILEFDKYEVDIQDEDLF